MGRSPSYDLMHQRFGQWTAMAYKQMGQWECRCDCGTVGIVQGGMLRTGRSQRCKKCARERDRQRLRTHGKTKTPEYHIWRGMQERCTNPRHENYARYGGRGIKIEWNSFEDFFADMGTRPSPQHTIERKENSGNYSKTNCCWATATEQANNRHTNVKILYQGKTQTVYQWARELDMTPDMITYRLKAGMPVEQVLTPQKRHRHITYQGKTQTLAQWAKELDITPVSLAKRLKKWSLERAMTEPGRGY